MTEAEKKWMHDNGDGTLTINTCAWSPPGDHPVGCGLVLTVKEGRLVKVEGDPNHPITQGRLCPRCLALDEFVYSKDRVLYPMKRDPKDRGKDKWERITWDEAVDLVEEKVRYIWDKYGPETIMVHHGTGREACIYAYSLAYAVLRTPNYSGTLSGSSCYGPRALAAMIAGGIGYPEIDYAAYFPDRYDDPRYQLPDYLIFWGKMPLYSSPDGLFGHAAIDMMQRGTKLITVDPRITWAGTRAEYNLQLRPGTDAALVLGIMNILIQEDLYDHDFVERWTYGFDELAQRCTEYPVDKVAEICGIPAEKILEVARAIGHADRVTGAWGLALDMQANGNQAAHGFLCLMALLGSFDVPGGLTIAPLKGFNAVAIMGKWRQKYTAWLPQELKDKLIYGGYEAFKASGYGLHGDSVLTAMETGEPYRPRMAWFYASNHNACMSASPADWDVQFLQNEFNVCQDVVMNPCAMAVCDLFLPVSSFVEHNGIVIPHFGRNTPFFGSINKAIEIGECKSDLEINFLLGKRLNPEIWPWDSPEDLYTWLLEDEPYNMTFEEFQNKSPVQTTYDYRKYETGELRDDGKPGFATPTGRFEFWRSAYPQWGLDPLPSFEEPPMGPISTPDLYKEYPLILTTGQRNIVSFHSEHRQIPSLRECCPDPLAQIHPVDAEKYGIKDGDWMCIENTYGKAVYKAQVVPIVKKGVVAATHAWWFPEEEGEAPNLYGVYKSNINQLIPNNVNGPTGFGTNYKSVLCKVYKVPDRHYLAEQNYPEKLNKVWEERL